MAKQKKRRKRKNKLFVILGACLALCACVITLGEQWNWPIPTWRELFQTVHLTESAAVVDAPLSVHFLDVGQGDSVLIKTKEKTALIDAGEKETGEQVVRYLQGQKVEQLDYVFCTHPHSDHMGGLIRVLQSIPVKNVVMPSLPASVTPTTSVYENFLLAVKQSGARAVYSKPGQTVALGNAVLRVLGPVKNYKDLNNASLVCRLDLEQVSFLFTGDQESTAEKDLLSSGANVRADVLKVGHHGSKTSTSAAFLRAVAPASAVISCGEGNDYGHPNSETLQRLRKLGVFLYRTDLQGTVVFTSDGKELQVHPERG